MTRPTIICHMMTSLDGRIDCAMTAKLPGVDHYYETLNALEAPTRVSGRVTAEMEMVDKADGRFVPTHPEAYGKEGFSKKTEAAGYEVIVDTKGVLRWDHYARQERPLLILTSEQVTTDYLDYLDGLGLSWIACGKDRIDLARAAEILAESFGVARMAVVGGGSINAAFLDAGILDEVSLLLAPGIDGRGGMTAVFDGLPGEREPFILTRTHVEAFDDGSLWLRYSLD